MTEITIYFGGSSLNLKKKEEKFNLILPQVSDVDRLRNMDGVSEVREISNNIWSVFTEPSQNLDSIMMNARESTVCHHAYEIADNDIPRAFIPTDIVNIKFADLASTELQEEISNRYSLIRIGYLKSNLISYRVTTNTGMNPLKLCNLLMVEDFIEFVEPDIILQNDPFANVYLDQWHLHNHNNDTRILQDSDIKVEEAWKITKGDPSIVIAILDDGFDLTNPDLLSSIVAPSDFTLSSVAPNAIEELKPDDLEPFAEREHGDYHGTPCAGLAIGRLKEKVSGVAPGCSWMPVRFNIGFTSQNTLLSIFKYISSHADVVSCSWGLQPSGYVNMSETSREYITELAQIGGRRGKGLVIVFAAGNYNLPTYLSELSNVKGMEYYDSSGNLLGRFFKNKDIHGGWTEIESVITVASITSRCRKSLYSNWGPNITVAAPSDNWHPKSVKTRKEYNSINLTTTENMTHGLKLKDVGLSSDDLTGYTQDMGGTSGATPIVAGVCGLILSVNPNLTSTEVRHLLCATADRSNLDFQLDEPEMFNNLENSGSFHPETGHSLWFGFGKVDAEAAVKASVQSRKG